MEENNQYGPDAYKRLELVKKQFQSHVAEQKKQEAAERNQRIISSLGQNKVVILRVTVYAVMAIVLIAVIATRVSEIFK